MMDKGKFVLVFLSIVAFVFIIFIGVVSVMSDNERVRNMAWCEQHGGTWFNREGKCIEVHEIKVPE